MGTWHSDGLNDERVRKSIRDKVSIEGVPMFGFDRDYRGKGESLFLRLELIGDVGITYELYGDANIRGLFRNTSSKVLEDLEGKAVYFFECSGIGIDDELRAENLAIQGRRPIRQEAY